jgi:CheY-like chemotaxis protein
MPIYESAILVLDDEQTIVDLTTAVLSGAGFTTFGTTDPDEAVRLVETNHAIRLLLSDVTMPKISGPEVVRRALKDRDGDVRVLFMSGGFDGVRFRRTDPLLAKPISVRRLPVEVHRILTELPVLAAWEGPERRRQLHAIP